MLKFEHLFSGEAVNSIVVAVTDSEFLIPLTFVGVAFVAVIAVLCAVDRIRS